VICVNPLTFFLSLYFVDEAIISGQVPPEPPYSVGSEGGRALRRLGFLLVFIKGFRGRFVPLKGHASFLASSRVPPMLSFFDLLTSSSAARAPFSVSSAFRAVSGEAYSGSKCLKEYATPFLPVLDVQRRSFFLFCERAPPLKPSPRDFYFLECFPKTPAFSSGP